MGGGGGPKIKKNIIVDQFYHHFSQFRATLILFIMSRVKNYFCFIFLLVGSFVSGMTSFSFVMLLKTTIPAGGWVYLMKIRLNSAQSS